MRGPAVWNGRREPPVQQLVRRCIGGDPAARDRLARRYRPFCRSIADRMLSDRYHAWADDVAQDAMFIVFRKLETWRGADRRSFEAWVGCITRREAIRVSRQLRRHEGFVGRNSRSLDSLGAVDQSAQSLEMRDWVSVFCRRLPRRCRQVLEALALGDRPREVAVRIGVAESTVRADLRIIRRQLSSFFGKTEERPAQRTA